MITRPSMGRTEVFMEPLLLRPEDAAKALGLGRSKMYALLADGTIPSVRVGTSLRVPSEALKAWVDTKLPEGWRSPRQARPRG
jgi:excisionase family DNA binding protein